MFFYTLFFSLKNRIQELGCILFVLSLSFYSLSAQENSSISFEHLSIENGLNKLSIIDILQDHQGFMWFATNFGLNKYDGYTITNYNFDNKDPNSISNDRIQTLFEDSDGILWIGTQNGGLNKYIRETDSFVHYRNRTSDSTSISNNHIITIYEDKKGNFWIGTASGGLNKMDKEKGTFTHYLWNPNDETSLPNNNVNDIFEDKYERLWIASLEGLSIFDRNTEKFFTYKNNPSDSESLSSNKVFSICEDEQGVLWIATSLGLNKFNENENTFSSYLIDYQDKSKNNIKKIEQDSFGNLWLGGIGVNGIYKFDKASETFSRYMNGSQNRNNLSYGRLRSIYEDRSNILWVGTGSGGVSIYNPKKASNFIHHKHNANKNSISDGLITSINEDSSGNIWLTNTNGVVDKIDLKGNVTHFNDFKKNGQTFPTSIADFLEDKNKNILIATNKGLYKLNKSTNFFEHQNISDSKQFDNFIGVESIEGDRKGIVWLVLNSNGLYSYNRDHGKPSFHSNPTDSLSISSEYITKVYEDPLGTLWVATVDGLNKMDKNTDTFTRYKHNPLDLTSISNNYIINLYKDYFGSLWVSTYYGLNVLDEKTGQFHHLYKDDGLPENIVFSILEDNHNNLWMTTKNHLSKFNRKTETFKTFNKGNGMFINEFYYKSSLKASNGKMYFGGVNGMIEFHPDSIKTNTSPPSIVLTDFKISNQSVEINKKSSIEKDKFYLNKNINVTDTINLSYLDNIFSFEFAALDYFHSTSNQYAYRMKGFNENWIYTNADNRVATYTNLDAGSYVFEVKGSNNDGLWNEEGKSVIIIITPPWWKTNWAYLLYGAVFLSSFFGFIQWRASKLKRDKKILLEKVKSKTIDLANKNNLLDHQNIQLQEQANKLLELDETKSRFFANISHEFRTPLTVILGLVNRQISNSKSANKSSDSFTIKRNANRLLQLINQLLDLSKIESGKVKLNVTKQNILLETKKNILLFESFAIEKGVTISFNDNLLDKEFPNEIIEVNFDRERFSKIVSNLLSNAIKFTNKNGFIKINIYKENNEVVMNFANSGVGIPAENIPYIFNRFYQIADESTRKYDGTGIGLALTKELVELHKGTIEAESDSAQTTFCIRMPLNLPISKIKTIDKNPIEDLTLDNQFNNSDSQRSQIFEEETEENQLEILIIEDNADIRNYINDILLDQDYKVMQATDGLDGLNKAESVIPDLIISDVMMPKMDGYELCKQLKTKENTNHIPVILLTAKASHENKLEGLETGADDYLTKPFDEKELMVRIKNLINLREKLQKKYQQESFLKPKNSKVNSVQQQFLEKIKTIVEDNIDNDKFTVEDLGAGLFMSRSQVHRKLKALTNQSATQFIRNYRLYRAADLLKLNSGNITEIAYQVGFSSQTYFSKCFQELFKRSPSEYKSS